MNYLTIPTKEATILHLWDSTEYNTASETLTPHQCLTEKNSRIQSTWRVLSDSIIYGLCFTDGLPGTCKNWIVIEMMWQSTNHHEMRICVCYSFLSDPDQLKKDLFLAVKMIPHKRFYIINCKWFMKVWITWDCWCNYTIHPQLPSQGYVYFRDWLWEDIEKGNSDAADKCMSISCSHVHVANI